MSDEVNGAGANLPLRVLVVDDEPGMANILSRIIATEKWDAMPAASLSEASSILAGTMPDVAVVDVHLAGEDGLTLVRQLRSRFPDIGILVISGEDSETLAVKASSIGADNFMAKPIAAVGFILALRKIAELRRSRQRNISLEKELKHRVWDSVFPEIVTQSDTMRAVLRLVEKVAPRDLSVLLCGESGTGKELVARAIHNLSSRARGEFVELNCAALPPSLVESELFGHEKGAFTGAVASRAGKIEQATGGTLLLDEVGELPLEIQPKLLRALQEKSVTRVGGNRLVECDFRLICATNRDLVQEVKEGRFREDLFYRVAVFPIKLPPLRDRREDLDLLIRHFLHQEGVTNPHITKVAHELLCSYDWPGNVRELRNFSQAALLLSEGRQIDETCVNSYFGSRLDLGVLNPAASRGNSGFPRAVRLLAEAEREEIMNALAVFHGNVGEAARALGIGRATLYNYLRKHGQGRKSAQPVTV